MFQFLFTFLIVFISTFHLIEIRMEKRKFLVFIQMQQTSLSQIASPACTELEVIMLDWLGKMLDLPKEFLACSGGKGGGVIQVNLSKKLV